MGRFKTKVITDESQVPEGFYRISEIAESLADQKRLSDAHTGGFIQAVKLMRSTEDKHGPVWVDGRAAKRFLRDTLNDKTVSHSKHSNCDSHTEAAVIALCEINNGISLMQATLERLTAAVELIATQPKPAQQELVSQFESNGFHQ